MASELQLDTRAVQVWFQNKRARERKSLGPMASEHLRRKTVKDGTFHLDTMGLHSPAWRFCSQRCSPPRHHRGARAAPPHRRRAAHQCGEQRV